MTEVETPEVKKITEIESITYDLFKYLKSRNIATSTGDLLFTDEVIDPEYIKSLYSEIDRLRKAIAQMLAEFQSRKIEGLLFEFFTYFINRFEEMAGDFIDTINEPGVKEADIRNWLIRLQSIYLRIFAVYTAIKIVNSDCSSKFSALKYLADYTSTQRAKILKTIYKEVEESEKKEELHIGANDNGFQSELAGYFYLINLKIIRTLFCYYTLYTFSNLPSKGYITDTIARALLYLQKLQERLDCANQMIAMKSLNFYQITVKIFNEIDVFLNFTQNVDMKTIIALQPPTLSIIPQETEGEVKGIIELFVSRSCPHCKKLFQTELWDLLQQIARRLKLRIKLIDIYFEANEALSYGIYYIERIPVLKFQSKLYWINPEEQPGIDPHITVKRELLNFFNILGLYDPKQKENAAKSPQGEVK